MKKRKLIKRLTLAAIITAPLALVLLSNPEEINFKSPEKSIEEKVRHEYQIPIEKRKQKEEDNLKPTTKAHEKETSTAQNINQPYQIINSDSLLKELGITRNIQNIWNLLEDIRRDYTEIKPKGENVGKIIAPQAEVLYGIINERISFYIPIKTQNTKENIFAVSITGQFRTDTSSLEKKIASCEIKVEVPRAPVIKIYPELEEFMNKNNYAVSRLSIIPKKDADGNVQGYKGVFREDTSMNNSGTIDMPYPRELNEFISYFYGILRR